MNWLICSPSEPACLRLPRYSALYHVNSKNKFFCYENGTAPKRHENGTAPSYETFLSRFRIIMTVQGSRIAQLCYSTVTERLDSKMAGSRSKLIASVCTAKQPRSPSDWCLCRQTSTLAILLLLCAIASAQPQPVRRVLILYEVGTSYPAINSIDEGIGESLSESHQRIQYYREYMETGLFPEPADQKEVRDYLVRKYRNRRPDVIITAGPSPLKLVSDLHERFFSGVPIIFCVPNDAEKELSLGPEFTGVTGELKGAETIKAALGLLPRTKHIFVVGGASKYDVGQVAAVKNQLSPFQEQADISVLGDVEMSTLLDRLKHLPDQSIVLFTTLSKDATGTLYTSRETGPLVTTAANAPVFSLFDVYLNHGEVGGDLSSLLDQGRVAGAMARKVLDGAKPADIPRSVAVNRFTFDWKALKRWSLDEKMLPAGSIVVNRQLTVWQIYKWYIIAGIAIILLQTLLISALLSQSIRRRMIEGDLAVIHERLRLAVQVGKAVGWDWDIVSGRNRWFGDLQTIFGKGSDTHEAAVMIFSDTCIPTIVTWYQQRWLTLEMNASHTRPNFESCERMVRCGGLPREEVFTTQSRGYPNA